MLTINGLHKFYFLPYFHDMRCKAQRISEIIRARYNRDPLNGDVYIFMSKDNRKVKMVHYENHAFYLLKTDDIHPPKTGISVHFSALYEVSVR